MAIEQHWYTSCPRGHGLENMAGFQVKARSSGITPAIDNVIREFCQKYEGPTSANKPESEELKSGNVSEKTLQKFPVALHYYRVDQGDTFALTRVQYVGRDYSHRYGNHFAHTLVFQARDLEPVGYNSLALARAKLPDGQPLFTSNNTMQTTELQSLPDFNGLSDYADQRWQEIVKAKLYHEHVANLVSATMKAWEQNTSVLLCLSFDSFNDSAALLESILMLLPSEIRCRITYTIYELNPYRFNPMGAPAQRRHWIATMSSEEGGRFQFQKYEYTGGKYAIFNFPTNEFSPALVPSYYVEHVVSLAQHNNIERLRQIHQIIQAFDAAQTTKTWDCAITIASLCFAPEELTDFNNWANACQELAGLSSNKLPQPLEAAKLVWHTFLEVARGEDEKKFEKLLDAYQNVLKQVTESPEQSQWVIKQPAELVVELVEKYATGRMKRVLGALGSYTERTVKMAAELLFQKDWPQEIIVKPQAFSELDSAGFVEVADAVLDYAITGDKDSTKLQLLLHRMFAVAKELGTMRILWKKIEAKILQAILPTIPEEQRSQSAEKLAQGLAEAGLFDESLRLSLDITKKSPPKKQAEIVNRFRQLARLAVNSSQIEEAVTMCHETGKSIYAALDLPVVIASIYEEVAMTDHAPPECLWKSYSASLSALQHKEDWRIRKQIAKLGLHHILAADFVAELSPWEDNPSDVGKIILLNPWCSGILANKPEFAKEFAKTVVKILERSGCKDKGLLTAFVGRSFPESGKLGDNGISAANLLAEFLVTILPLAPLPLDYWNTLKQLDSAQWNPNVKRRWEIIKRLTAIGSTKVCQSLPDCLQGENGLAKVADKLDPPDFRSLWSWLFEQLKLAKVRYVPTDAPLLVHFLLQSGGVSEAKTALAEFLQHCFDSKCTVIRIYILGQFAKVGMDKAFHREADMLAEVIADVLSKASKLDLKLFWELMEETSSSLDEDTKTAFNDFLSKMRHHGIIIPGGPPKTDKIISLFKRLRDNREG